jgi:hypothetical protein
VQILCAIAGLVRLNISGANIRLCCPREPSQALQLQFDAGPTDSFVWCLASDIYRMVQDTLFELLAQERNQPLLGVYRQTHSTMLGALVYLAFLECDPLNPAVHCSQTVGEIITMIALHLYLTDLTIVEVSVDCMNSFAQTRLIVDSMEKVCEKKTVFV